MGWSGLGSTVIVFDTQPSQALLDFLAGRLSSEKDSSFASDPALGPMFKQLGIRSTRASLVLNSARNANLRRQLSPTEAAFSEYLSAMREGAAMLRDLMRALVEEQDDLTHRAFARTKKFLPSHVRVDDATVVLLPMGYDARVDYTTVYLDPMLALLVGQAGVSKLLSHEFHHLGRYAITGENLSGMSTRAESKLTDLPSTLRHWISLLELEGIADCVFDMTEFDLPVHRKMIAERNRVRQRYGRFLAKIEVALLRVPPTSGRPRSRSPAVQTLLRSHVHPLGRRLAETVLTGLGRARLVECVGNPPEFLNSYQEVARKQGAFQFGPVLVARLQREWAEGPGRGTSGMGGP